MPTSQLILTAVGNDRPGLVGELTGHLHAAGVNILDSRMVNLRGRFAVSILLEVRELDSLKRALASSSERMGLTLQFPEPAAATPPRIAGIPYRLKSYS